MSIIGEKYRGVKKEPDWLALTIAAATGKTKDVQVTKPNPKNPDEKVTTTEQRPDGIDVDKLFALADENGLTAKVEKFKAQRDHHGFAGRFRMTVRNMLHAVTKQRHGLTVGGKWVPADAAWLAANSAPAEPTHKKNGEKIAPPKAAPAADPAAAKAAPEKGAK